MNIDRLLRLREILQIEANTVYPKFYMGSWADYSNKCGTSACALGRAALDPVLRAQGLKLIGFNWPDNEADADGVDWAEMPSLAFIDAMPSEYAECTMSAVRVELENHRDPFKAAQAFFDINYTTARYLFAPGSYPIADGPWHRFGSPKDITEKHVIEHIDRLLGGTFDATSHFTHLVSATAEREE